MTSTIDRLVEERSYGNSCTFGKWVSLTSSTDRFDINCGRVQCKYSKADFMATADGDVVIVVPAAFHFVSQMVAHAVLSDHCCGTRVEIVVRRSLVRCERSYRFAYVDGRLYEVMGVSDTFTFIHPDGPCDCDTLNDGDSSNTATGYSDESGIEPSTTTSDPPTSAVTVMSSFISSLMDTRSKTSQCSICRAPSNYRQFLEYLMKNINLLTDVHSNLESDHTKQITCLKNCTALLEYQNIKTKMLNREMENCRRFIDDLVSSLLKNRQAIIRTAGNTIFMKTDHARESEWSATERFMDSIINSQKQIIENLTATYKEISIMMNTMQFFGKLL